MGNSISLSFSVAYSSYDKYSGSWTGFMKGSDYSIRDIKFEYISTTHGNEQSQKEHKKLMIDAISEVCNITRYNKEPSLGSTCRMSIPSKTDFNLTTGSTYNICINGVVSPCNRLRNNLVTLSYSHKDILFDIVIKNQKNITSLPRTMF